MITDAEPVPDLACRVPGALGPRHVGTQRAQEIVASVVVQRRAMEASTNLGLRAAVRHSIAESYNQLYIYIYIFCAFNEIDKA
jgi:hypothetical protein